MNVAMDTSQEKLKMALPGPPGYTPSIYAAVVDVPLTETASPNSEMPTHKAVPLSALLMRDSSDLKPPFLAVL